MTIKFFISYHHGAGFGHVHLPPATALDLVRRRPGAKTLPVRPLTGDDFAEFHQRIILAELGYFSIDLPEHKARRAEQEARKWEIAAAYHALGINQKREYDRIAGAIPNSEGTWPRSTARYARDVESLDNCVLAHAEDLDKPVAEVQEMPKSLELRRDIDRVNGGFRFGTPPVYGIDGFPEERPDDIVAYGGGMGGGKAYRRQRPQPDPSKRGFTPK